MIEMRFGKSLKKFNRLFQSYVLGLVVFTKLRPIFKSINLDIFYTPTERQLNLAI